MIHPLIDSLTCTCGAIVSLDGLPANCATWPCTTCGHDVLRDELERTKARIDVLLQPMPRYHGHYSDHCRLIINATRMDDVVTRADYNTVRRCLILLPDDLRLRWISVMDTLTIVEDGSVIEA